MNRGNSTATVVIISLLVVLCCCFCLIVIGIGGATLSLFTFEQDGSVSFTNFVTATPVVIRPTAVPTHSASGKLDAPDQSDQTILNPPPTDDEDILISNQKNPAQNDTLEILENANVPINDLRDLAQRLEGKENIPLTVNTSAKPYQVGDKETFWVTNVDTNENSTIEAVLRYATGHAYFWIENGVPFDEDELSALAETFEHEIYVINREFFGSEWIPGVDNDPHLYIIFANDLGYSLAGYFSSVDEYHPLAHEYSNAHETFMLNADNVDLDDEFTYGVLAHEF